MATAYAGVDMSYHQTDVDYKALKAGKIGNAPVKFAMLRSSLGYNKDLMFDEHYKGCKDAGLYVGVYHWIVAQNVTQARKESQWLVELLKGYEIDYPVVLDFEDSDLFALKLSKEKYTAIVHAFMGVLKSANYYVMLYTNPDTLENRLLPEVREQYDLWLAHWVTRPTDYGQKMWQYAALGTAEEVSKGWATAVGKVPGLKMPCDVNWSYVGYAALIRKLGQNKAKAEDIPTVVVATKLCKTAAELTAAENQLKSLGYEYNTVATK